MEEKINDIDKINPESLINNIKEKESNNIYLIQDENIIMNIISFIQNKTTNIENKYVIIKYLTKCINLIPINTDIFLNQKINDECLYHIIIYEYIINKDQIEYKNELKKLLSEILKNIGYDINMYHYLISFISDYINKKTLLLNEDIKNRENIPFKEKIKFNDFNSNHLLAILELIQIFYEEGNKIVEPRNYIYFSGKENDNIIIKNESLFLDTKHDIYIMLFINLFDKKYLEKFESFYLLTIKLNNDISINVNIIPETSEQKKQNNCIYIPYDSFKLNEINQVLIKISKNNNLQILINNTLKDSVEVSFEREDINSIILFDRFIGFCSSIILYKHPISNVNFIPKFFSDREYKNGIYKEELFTPFIKSQLTISVDYNFVTDKNLLKLKDKDISEFKNFYNNNLISIFIPTRSEVSEDSKNIILFDSKNNLNLILSNNNLRSGIHSLSQTIKAFYDLGSINHLLPIIELITKDKEFKNSIIFNKFICIICFIFSNLPDYFQLFDKNAQFFFYLSYFLEKIDDKNNEIFNEEFCKQIILLNNIFIKHKDNKNYNLFIKNFFENILLNPIILFKFNYELQKEIINEIKNSFIINDKSKATKLSIIKTIKILLYYDSHKNNKYCCKEHSLYFKNENENEISQPEVNVLIEPLINLIKELIKLYLSNFKTSNSNITSSRNNTQQISDYNLDKIIELLTFDISPCLQKAILNIFYELKNNTKELNRLNKKGKIFSILLFLLKTTIFNDIRLLVYDFIFVFINDKNLSTNIETNLNSSNSNNNSKNTNNNNENFIHYIENNIVPFYLFMDEKEVNYNVKNLSGELQEEKFNEYFFIDNIRYNYLVLSYEQKFLNSNYKKEKLDELITSFFDKVYNNFYQGSNIKINLNILIKLISKGNALLSLNFLDKITLISNTKDIKLLRLVTKQQTEILSNINLLHWLLEESFHVYLLKEQIQGHINGEYNYGIIFPLNYTEKEKKAKIDKMLEMGNNLIIKILNNDIYKLDYVLTWSKYYYSIIEEINNFKLIRDFVHDFILSKLMNNIKEIYMANISTNKVQQTSLYFYNIIFEYYTFLKIKTSLKNNGPEDLENLYQEINSSFKLSVLNEANKDINENTKEDIYDIFPKLQFYNFMKKVFNLFQPLWKDESTKIKNDKDFYASYIYHKQNIAVYELELLFYSFNNDSNESKLDEIYTLGNTGISLVYILFHQFTILLMTNEKKEFKEIMKNFRYFISLIIISSTTLCVSKNKGNNNSITRDKDKINWPNEEQYKNIQKKVKLLLFNFFHFLYYKITEINQNIKNSENNKIKNENYKSIKKYLYDTLCYFLRILDCILKEKIKREEEKKKKNIKAMFSAIKKMITTKNEGIDLAGAYFFFYELFTKCFIKNIDVLSNNKKSGDNTEIINSLILSTRSFIDDIPIYNVDAFLNENQSYNKTYEKIEKVANTFMENQEVKKYLDDNFFEYQKILFPFCKIIFNRKELVSHLIPIYDNSIYCGYKYDKYNSICLLPNYFPIYLFDKNNYNNIKKINSIVSDEIRISNIKNYFDKYEQNTKYYKLKKRLFIFKGLWSKEEFYYDKKNYEIKYKVFNHLTDEFMKIFLTPIIDINYYLPKFSSFNTKELFRHHQNNNNVISLERMVDLSSDIIEENIDNNLTDNNMVNKEKPNNNDNNKGEEVIMSNILAIKKTNYKFIEDLSLKSSEENIENHFKLITTFIQKINLINISDHCSIDQCCLVKSSFHIKGIFYNNFSEIGFYSYSKLPFNELDEDTDYDQERKACFGSVFKSQKEKYDGYYLKIPYNQIAFVLKRRYFFKTIALEIYTVKNKSYYFKFNEKDAKKIYENIKHNMKSTIEDIYIEYSRNDSKIGFVNNNDNNNLFINSNILMYKKKDMNLKNLFEKWQNWEMSTFKFLMFCNIYANRSLNDINQYPVYPWIITNYKDKEILLENNDNIRPFETPMGMLTITPEAEARKEEFLELWQNLKEDGQNDPNYGRYGVHYSTSTYVSHYLVRVFPFSNIRIEMQGAKFDDPNRLFLKLDISFNNAITQKTDLRELIPEAFSLPEMFYNSNNLKLGTLSEKLDEEENKDTKDKEENSNNCDLVNDVGLPFWADNDGYIFIKKHREFLESQKINEKINEWFNIIFGSKQKGNPAKKINNLYLEQTYEDFEEKYNKLSTEEKMNCNHMVEFGVTPNQIFKSDTNKRKAYSDLKNMKTLLYNIIDNKSDNLTFEEIETDFDNEQPYRIFEYQKDGYKKWRIFILTKKNVKIYSKIIDKIEPAPEGGENKLNNNTFTDSIKNVLKGKEIIKLNIKKKDDILLPQYGYRFINDKIYYEYSVIFANGQYIALTGYYNGNIIVKSLDYKNKDKEGNKSVYIYSTNDNSPVTKLIIDNSNTYAICANKRGTILIFIISPEKKYVWMISKVITHQKTELSALSINENLNIFISCSKYGNCMVYCLPRIKLINSFNIESPDEKENIFCSSIFIYHAPLPCFIFYIKNLNAFLVYSINGKFLKKYIIEYDIEPNGITKYIDYQMRDYLIIYNKKDKTIDIHRAIDFQLVTKSPIINYKFIGFVINKEFDHALILVNNNNQNDEKQKENENNAQASKYKILVLKDKNDELFWK